MNHRAVVCDKLFACLRYCYKGREFFADGLTNHEPAHRWENDVKYVFLSIRRCRLSPHRGACG